MRRLRNGATAVGWKDWCCIWLLIGVSPSSGATAPSDTNPMAATGPSATGPSATDPRAPTDLSRFTQATQKFEEARAGSAEATPIAQAAFRELLVHDPDNPLYLAYFGSTLAMQARDGHLPWQRVKAIHDSMSTIDKAIGLLRPEHDRVEVRGLPLSLETRLVAVATYVALPEVLHRLPTAKQQLALAMNSPVFDSAPPELRGRFFYEAALIAQAERDTQRERTALKQVLMYAPASLNLREIRARLTELGG
jgi:hypothetical protein